MLQGPVLRVPSRELPSMLLLLTAALLWHALSVLGPEKPSPPEGSVGRDYATYHYAVEVALAGGDPYDTPLLTDAARAEAWHTTPVHPLLYPPAALFGVIWAPALSLPDAANVFRVLGELLMAAGVLALMWLWRPLGPRRVLALLAATLALMGGVAYGVQLGQANPHVWGLTLAGLAVADDDRPARQALGGGLLACAVLGKLSPLAFVGLWLLDRRWVAVGSTLVATVLGCLLSFAVVGTEGQAHFWMDVLPSLSSGDYNGLTIRIGLFANHSIPALLDHLLPGPADSLGTPARTIATFGTLAIGVVLAALFRGPASDPLGRAGRIGAVGVLLLLVPVYTFEHHLIWATPAIVVCAIAAFERRIPLWVAIGVGMAAAAVCTPIVPLRRLHGWVSGFGRSPALLVEELKLGALLTLFVTTTWLGRTRRAAPGAGGQVISA